VEDDPEKLSLSLAEALTQSDMGVTTGGVSVGDYDFTREAVRCLGSELLFWKINMKPGGTVLASVKDSKLILSLSGNPGAAVLGLLRVALPYIRKLCGRSDLYPEEVRVQLRQPMEKASPMMRLLRGRLMIEDGTTWFLDLGGQKGGDLSSLRDCDLIAEIGPGSPPLPAGAIIRAYRI
jgi:molybdopterin molybdotransferase